MPVFKITGLVVYEAETWVEAPNADEATAIAECRRYALELGPCLGFTPERTQEETR